MSILFELVLWPVLGLVQGVAGMLWPSDQQHIHRLQRWTAGFAATGFAALLVCVAASFLGAPMYLRLASGAMAYLAFIVSGIIGRRIERHYRAE
jgi:hypothetical protein